jgi:hypothetical protein
MAGAFLSPEELTALLNQQTGTPQRTAGAFAAPQLGPDPFAGQTAEMGFSPEDPTMSTGDMGLSPAPQRMLAGAWDMITRKRQAGVPLSPQEEAMVASGEQYKAQVGEPGAINLAGELSGVNAMGRGASNFAAGAREGSPLQMAAGAGEAALGAFPALSMARPAAPLINALTSSIPRATAFAGAATVPGAMLASQEASAAKTADQVRSELSRMQPADIAAFQRQIGVNPDGKVGPATVTAAVEYDRRREADAAKAAEGDNAAKVRAAEIEAQGRADAARERARAELASEQKAKAAKTPFRDLMPELMPWMPAASIIGGGAVGGLIKGLYGRAFNKGMDSLESRLQSAVDAGNKPLAQGLQNQATQMRAAGPGGTKPALAGAAGLGTEISLIPDEIDLWRGVKQQENKGILDHLAEVGGRGVIGAALATAPALTASKITGAIQQRPTLNLQPEIDAIKASRGKAAPRSSTADATLEQALNATQTARDATALAEAANQQRRRAGSGTAGSSAQSPRPSTSPKQESSAVAPQSQPSGGSGQSSSVSPSNKSGDNTAAVSPRQFVPGQRPEPVSGLRKSQIVQDEAMKDLVRNMYARGEPVTALTFRDAAKEVLGRDMTKGQAGRSLKDLKADEIASELRENFRKDRERLQRAARRAQEKKNAEKPPTDTDL